MSASPDGRAELEARVRDLEAEQARLIRDARLQSDRAEQAEETARELREDLAAAQLRTVRALRDHARVVEERDALVAELEAVRKTRTFRYTEQLRHAYSALRGNRSDG